jgi:hypothetical protein
MKAKTVGIVAAYGAAGVGLAYFVVAAARFIKSRI